jgi:uncharacterized membrane protein (UPF0182 family)
MVAFVLPKDKVVSGPQQIASRIQQTPEISRDRTLLNSIGSTVIQSFWWCRWAIPSSTSSPGT